MRRKADESRVDVKPAQRFTPARKPGANHSDVKPDGTNMQKNCFGWCTPVLQSTCKTTR
jgi:hypothetical protein